MGNRSVYVRDEDLWTRAKELAGSDGLSSVISEALATFVRKREQETRDMERTVLAIRDVATEPVTEDDGSPRFVDKERVGLDGRLLGHLEVVSALTGREGEARVYLTRGRQLVVVLHEVAYDIDWDYEVFASSGALRTFLKAPGLEANVDGVRQLMTTVADGLGETWTTWID
jgi:hypothetical protein